MYVMLWRIDAGDYAGALEIGRHALRHGWVMPLGNRNVQTVLAEEMADAAQSAMLATTGFDADLLLQTLELTDGLDMPDQSRARLHKAIGTVLSESNPASALNHLNHALQLDPRCGVKKTNSNWSADCAMTVADRTCPRARAARGGERHRHIKTSSTALYFRRKQHEVCCARTGTGTGGNHQKYAVLA